jgi:SAM-dependent methyltransferase
LLVENKSLFRINTFLDNRVTSTIHAGKDPAPRFHFTPEISKNIKAPENFRLLAKELLARQDRARVLVVGGGVIGEGMQDFANNSSLELVETDVWLGPRTKIVCDAHDLPFCDASFDGVVVQAVLEHVLDPCRCVAEIHRVLKPRGLVYAETPFMQQVHMGRNDFTRFTHLGHRRLFRFFEEHSSGPVCGPGMALAWSFQYFLLSFVQSQHLRRIAYTFSAWVTFFLKYFDFYLISKPGAIDAASGFFFLGYKSDHALSDSALLTQYRGLK